MQYLFLFSKKEHFFFIEVYMQNAPNNVKYTKREILHKYNRKAIARYAGIHFRNNKTESSEMSLYK